MKGGQTTLTTVTEKQQKGVFSAFVTGSGSLRPLPEHLCRLSWAAVLHSIKRDPPAPHVYELVLPISPADSCGHPAAQQRHLFFFFIKAYSSISTLSWHFFLPCKHQKETL